MSDIQVEQWIDVLKEHAMTDETGSTLKVMRTVEIVEL